MLWQYCMQNIHINKVLCNLREGNGGWEKLENLIQTYYDVLWKYLLFDTIMTINMLTAWSYFKWMNIKSLFYIQTLQILILYALRVSSAIAEVISLRLGKLQWPNTKQA